METACRARRVPGRLIPLPGEISAGCGLAWSTAPENREKLLRMAEENQLIYEALHEILF